MELHEDVVVEMRVRQYANAQQDEYYDAVDWATISTGGAQEVLVPVNKNAINAGGNTILQFKITSVGGVNFASGLTIKPTTPWTLKTQLVPENRVVTICDEKDNYRFGYSGHEKDNEIKGLGNSLDMGARMLDTRLGRTPTIDPKAALYPGISPYAYALNTPIQAKDPDGNVVIFINGMHNGFEGGKSKYWNGFDNKVMNRFGDHKAVYRDGSFGGAFNLLSNLGSLHRSDLDLVRRSL